MSCRRMKRRCGITVVREKKLKKYGECSIISKGAQMYKAVHLRQAGNYLSRRRKCIWQQHLE